jgi:hypothetical protein
MHKLTFEKLIKAYDINSLPMNAFNNQGEYTGEDIDQRHFSYSRNLQTSNKISDLQSYLLAAISYHLQEKNDLTIKGQAALMKILDSQEKQQQMKVLSQKNDKRNGQINNTFQTLIKNYINSPRRPFNPIFQCNKETPTSFNDMSFSKEFNNFLSLQLKKRCTFYVFAASIFIIAFISTIVTGCLFSAYMTTIALIIPLILTSIYSVGKLYHTFKHQTDHTTDEKKYYRFLQTFVLCMNVLNLGLLQAHVISNNTALSISLGLLGLCAGPLIYRASELLLLKDPLEKIEHIVTPHI